MSQSRSALMWKIQLLVWMLFTGAAVASSLSACVGPASLVSCDFSHDFCGFSNGSTGVRTNQWFRAYEVSGLPGHNGSPYFTYAHHVLNTDPVDLTSPAVCYVTEVCVTFDYVISQSDYQLRVLTQCAGQQANSRPEDVKVFNYTNGFWASANVTLSPCTGVHTKVIFRGFPYVASFSNAVGLDSVKIKPCPAPAITESFTSKSTVPPSVPPQNGQGTSTTAWPSSRAEVTQPLSTGQGRSLPTSTSHFQSNPSDAAWETTTAGQSSFSSTSSPQQKKQAGGEPSGDNTGVIIGSVTGAVIAIVIIVVAVLVAVRARSRKPVSALLTQDGTVDPEDNTAEGPSQSIQDTGTVPENKAPRQTSLLTQAADGPTQTSDVTQEVTMVPDNEAVGGPSQPIQHAGTELV